MGIRSDSWYFSATGGSGIPSRPKFRLVYKLDGDGCSQIMIEKLDGLTTLLVGTVFAAFLLFSCGAKQAPKEIKVTVPADFSGEMTLDPCTNGLPAEVSLNARGTAPTSACPKPGETVTLTVVKSGQNYRVPTEEVKIERAGDGLPVAIKARVR